MAKFFQGRYVPRNPDKYRGDVSNIIFRSSWERKLMIWLDTTDSILAWSSEENIIPYISPIDNRPHRYFPDFVAWSKTRDGSIKKVIIEVKPKAQTMPPIKPSKTTRRYVEQVQTYLVNEAKWKAAKEWCSKNNYEFHILTEDHLNV